jgi:methionine biosynthesis protein MetW
MSSPKYDLANIFEPKTAHPDESHSIQMRYIPEKSRVLELGCATGYMSAYMEQALGCQVTGLEYDEASAKIARERCHEVFVVDLDKADSLAPAQNSAPYDVALIANVLEHLKYPERVLRDVHALLKPDGRLIVVLPNIAYWQVRLRLLLGKFDYEEYGVMDRTHLHFYTVKTGRELLENAAFELEEFRIAGSLVQNSLNKLARHFNRPLPKPIVANLFGYELIYIARRRDT